MVHLFVREVVPADRAVAAAAVVRAYPEAPLALADVTRLAMLPEQVLLRTEVRERTVPHRDPQAAQDPAGRWLQVHGALRVEDAVARPVRAGVAAGVVHDAEVLLRLVVREPGHIVLAYEVLHRGVLHNAVAANGHGVREQRREDRPVPAQ